MNQPWVYMCPYMQDSKRDTDVKNRLLYSMGEDEGGMNLREYHWNMYITVSEIYHLSSFDALDRVLRAWSLGQPWGMGWEGIWEGGSDENNHGWLKPLKILSLWIHSCLMSLLFDILFVSFPHEPISWVSWLWNKNYLGGKKGANCETHLKHF